MSDRKQVGYRNRYFAMRHGRSLANERGIIVSDPAIGIPEWGLAEEGRAAVEMTARSDGAAVLGPDAVCISSDFRRARETAEILCRLRGMPDPILEPALRERFFGELEGQSSDHYAEVWQHDPEQPDAATLGAESANQVRGRLRGLLGGLEEQYSGRHIVLVAHGDTLQILQTIFQGLDAGLHRELPHLQTAELRALNGGSGFSGDHG